MTETGSNTPIPVVFCIDAEPAGRQPVSIGLLPAVYVLLVSLPLVIYGIFPAPVLNVARQATKPLLS